MRIFEILTVQLLNTASSATPSPMILALNLGLLRLWHLQYSNWALVNRRVRSNHSARSHPEAEFLNRNLDKSLKSFPHCYSQSTPPALPWDFRKGERRKTCMIETIPPSLWFKKPIQKPQVWETSTKLYLMNKLWTQSLANFQVHEENFSEFEYWWITTLLFHIGTWIYEENQGNLANVLS